jgi:hypothetical protein
MIFSIHSQQVIEVHHEKQTTVPGVRIGGSYNRSVEFQPGVCRNAADNQQLLVAGAAGFETTTPKLDRVQSAG